MKIISIEDLKSIHSVKTVYVVSSGLFISGQDRLTVPATVDILTTAGEVVEDVLIFCRKEDIPASIEEDDDEPYCLNFEDRFWTKDADSLYEKGPYVLHERVWDSVFADTEKRMLYLQAVMTALGHYVETLETPTFRSKSPVGKNVAALLL